MNKAIARARWLISVIMNLFANRGTSKKKSTTTQYKFQPRAFKPHGSRLRRRVRYSYLASSRRVHVGSVILKRFELHTKSGRRIISRRFKVLKHGYLVAA
ncbi:MAG TPA: hypothetical protein VLR90_07780 [Blastocatellia bacterium]|nr:hypothetical protein [Blastocatellia bacterium]